MPKFLLAVSYTLGGARRVDGTAEAFCFVLGATDGYGIADLPDSPLLRPWHVPSLQAAQRPRTR